MPESEWQTRKKRIDKRLKAWGWEIVPHESGMLTSLLSHHAVEEYPTANGPADYALFVEGKFLGILEAKKVSVNPQNVLEQAKRYSEGAFDGSGSWGKYKVPFLFASNGELIWFVDARPKKLVSRQVFEFPTADGLAEAFGRDDKPAFDWLLDTPIENNTDLRPYQRDCLLATENALRDSRREMLLAMATGTGKTFTTVSQCYRLLESKLARRILFLVDRKALAAQAVRAFNSFNTPRGNKFTQEYEVYSQKFQKEDFGDEDKFNSKILPNEYLTAPKPSHTFVYVSTIQRMSRNLFGAEGCLPQWGEDSESDEDASKLDIPMHAFDVIIADECHRGYTAQETSIWRAVMQHFDGVKIGLTATPAAHTVALFGEPVFRYGVEQAILDGFLVDYEAVSIKSDIRMKGVFLKEGEMVENVDTETGAKQLDLLEDERAFASEQVEKDITAPQSNKAIMEEVAKYAYEHEAKTGRFPKMLIFAANDIPHKSHANQLVETCRKLFNQGDDFVQKITGNADVDRPLQRIREFRNRPKPSVVVTVDMLSTGVDIPALEFIVFLRPVKSRILWEQMLGRGTRKCPEINKEKFVIFDCFDGTLIDYFRKASNFAIEPPKTKPLTIAEVVEKIWQNIDRDYHTKVLVKRLRRIEHNMSGEARLLFARFISDGDIGAFVTSLPKALKENFTETMKLLRNEEFQDLLVNYPRPKTSFIIAGEAKDSVSSAKVERYGKFDNAEDYLEAFAKFVKENSNKVDAIKILLTKPRAWKGGVLEDLKVQLTRHDFAEKQLQKAHQARGCEHLADIISIVKRAANNQAPLLTAEERVNQAITKLMSDHKFNAEQKQWLSLIAVQMATTLSLEEDDFDLAPLLEGKGGKGKAKKVFGELFPVVIGELNEGVAA
jgi:type I restriction enzyme, R subunit